MPSAPFRPSIFIGCPTPRVVCPRCDSDGRCRGLTPTPRGTVSRAKGVSPDDRSLEALGVSFRCVSHRGLDRRRRHHRSHWCRARTQDILRSARTSREAGRFEDAEIYFRQALQLERQGRGDSRGIRRPVSRLGGTRCRPRSGRTAHRTDQPSAHRGQVRQGDQGTASRRS